jgi:hypothetical protein
MRRRPTQPPRAFATPPRPSRTPCCPWAGGRCGGAPAARREAEAQRTQARHTLVCERVTHTRAAACGVRRSGAPSLGAVSRGETRTCSSNTAPLQGPAVTVSTSAGAVEGAFSLPRRGGMAASRQAARRQRTRWLVGSVRRTGGSREERAARPVGKCTVVAHFLKNGHRCTRSLEWRHLEVDWRQTRRALARLPFVSVLGSPHPYLCRRDTACAHRRAAVARSRSAHARLRRALTPPAGGGGWRGAHAPRARSALQEPGGAAGGDIAAVWWRGVRRRAGRSGMLCAAGSKRARRGRACCHSGRCYAGQRGARAASAGRATGAAVRAASRAFGAAAAAANSHMHRSARARAGCMTKGVSPS